TQEQLLQCLTRPTGPVDVVLDTDAYNEIDDQFALAYLLRYSAQCHVQALYAAPFFNERSSGPADGMEKSYQEIHKLLRLAGCEALQAHTFRGSEAYLPNEETPVLSPAAADLAHRAMQYSTDKPLYVVAIGAITNVASALLLAPAIKDRMVLVWLGGHAWHWTDTKEFNMMQDVAGARVVFGCGVPLVQLPCMGVVSAFATTEPELRYWLQGKNALCDYLVENTVAAASAYAAGTAWSRVIWDVTAVAWLVDPQSRFLQDRLEKTPMIRYDHTYDHSAQGQCMRYVDCVHRDALFTDVFQKLAQD
ncbi:MAG: nucleoside hydrolase, partial [Clostridia bacterium]